MFMGEYQTFSGRGRLRDERRGDFMMFSSDARPSGEVRTFTELILTLSIKLTQPHLTDTELNPSHDLHTLLILN